MQQQMPAGMNGGKEGCPNKCWGITHMVFELLHMISCMMTIHLISEY